LKSNSRRILCVDDDSQTLSLRKLQLEMAGYSVLTAPSGAEALQMLAQGVEADAVLLDYVMPGMKGDELAEKLRELYPNLRLVAVSAVDELPPAMLNMVDSHIQKGSEPEILLTAVAAVLARDRDQRQHDNLIPPKTILCVDDEQLQLQLRRALLESAGFKVLQAQSAKAAMDIFRGHQIDAVVMDYWLSDRNGTAVAEEMKRLRPRTPIVMLSGFSSLPGEGAVVDAWLRKAAIEPEDLVNEVKRLIGLRAEVQQPAIS
jgi:two-component system, OmpR family, response regulator CpxR